MKKRFKQKREELKIMKKNIKKFTSIILSLSIIASAVTVFAENEESLMSVEYNQESGAEPAIQLYSSGTQLTEGTDYDLTYENNINVGTATVTITFKGNYTGKKTVNFNITAKSLSVNDVVFADIEKQTYTGSAITPEPVITYNDVTLEKGKDYELTYENNINVGMGTVNVTFKGNYSGTASATFEITAKTVTDSTDIEISVIPDQTYTGKEITPDVNVADKSINR